MKIRTFAVLLAAGMMMLAGITAMLCKMEISRADRAENVSASVREAEKLIHPVEMRTVTETFGMKYSEECGCWSLNDGMTYAPASGDEVAAPLSGMVENIENEESGGARVVLKCEDIRLVLGPVFALRVFEGSAVSQGEQLGTARGNIRLQAFVSGMPVDPILLAEDVSFSED